MLDVKHHIYFFVPWEIFHAFLLSADFFQNQLFRKKFLGIPSDILSGLIWIQTVCKSYQQMTLVGKELKDIEIVLLTLGLFGVS